MSIATRRLLPLALLIIAALPLFAPALARHELFTFRDHGDYFVPLRLYTSHHLRAGRLPLWNPYNASGEPWLANPQTGVFYPPAWIFLALPFAAAYTTYLLLHVVLTGYGAFLLFSLDAKWRIALTAAVALMLSGPLLSLMDVSDNLTSFAWVPWVMWCARRDRTNGSGLTAGVLLAMTFLAGEPFFAAIAALLYIAIVRDGRRIFAAGVVAAGLSAIELFPFLDALRGSNRLDGGFTPAEILRGSMPLHDWRFLFVPPRFGRPAEEFIYVVYAGVFVLALALAGTIFLARDRDWKRLAAWGSLILATALVARGPSVLARLPVAIVRYPARVLPFAVLGIVALAAVGLERLRRWGTSVDGLILAAIAVDLLVAAQPLVRTAPMTRYQSPYPPMLGRETKILPLYGDAAVLARDRDAWIAGYLNLLDLRLDALTAAPLMSSRYQSVLDAAWKNVAVLRQSGIGWILANGPLPGPFLTAGHVGAVIAYRVAGAPAMAYVKTAKGTLEPVRSLALDASHAVVRTAGTEGGLLVLTQNDADGWSVTIDGRPARPRRFLGAFRAVEVPAGEHQVMWTYRPPALVAGAIVTAITALIVALMAIVTRRSFAWRTPLPNSSSVL